jgi:hypothetical protein
MFLNWSVRLETESAYRGKYVMIYANYASDDRFSYSAAYHFSRNHIGYNRSLKWYAPANNFLIMARKR